MSINFLNFMNQIHSWDIEILINQSDWLASPAGSYAKVIIQLKVLDTLG